MLTPHKRQTLCIFDAGCIYFVLSMFGGHILYILFSSCQLAPFSYPDLGFSVLFPQL
jgi:hypothetical protein